jgi:hypothetical protein
MSYSGNKVVLSWSGETSRKIALALSRFLKLTLHAGVSRELCNVFYTGTRSPNRITN